MASWCCLGDEGPSCWGRQRRILGRGRRRCGAGRKRGLESGGLRARTPRAPGQVSTVRAWAPGRAGRATSRDRWDCSDCWDWQKRACGAVQWRTQQWYLPRLTLPSAFVLTSGALGLFKLYKGRRLRCVVENLALKVESCFCCSRLPEKWGEQADLAPGTGLREPGSRPLTKARPGRAPLPQCLLQSTNLLLSTG